MSLKEIMSLAVAEGKIAIAWFNNYSGVVVKTPTSTLIFDPVGVRLGDVPRADVIVVTHEHYDHFEVRFTRDLQRQTNAVVVTTPFVANQLRVVPEDKLRAMKVGDALTIRGVGLNAEHSDHPGRQPLTFILTTENNLRVYHSSDSRPFPEMRGIGERYKPDIALCTVGIAPGASPRSGAEIAKLVRPRVAIPYHTDRLRSLQEFAEILKREAPKIGTKIIKQFDVYQYPE